MLLGFDIGGTKCAVIIGEKTAGDNISIADKSVIPTAGTAFETIDALFSLAELMLERKHISKNELNGIGISCGGPLNSKTGVILSPPNLPGWDNIPIVRMTEDRFGKKAILQNDANACAVSEWAFGAGKGYENIIFLTFGTGMGAGLILNGKLYAGTNDMAGEVGHIRMAEKGPVGYGKEGSFEGFCSGGGIAQLARAKASELMESGATVSFCKSMDELPFISAKSVAEAAYAGDPVALDIYRTCGVYLGRGISQLVDILNPEVVILGSIYGRVQTLLEPAMREVLERETLSGALQVCKIMPAMLGENIGDYAALALAAMA